MDEIEARQLWLRQTGSLPERLVRCPTGLCQSVFRVDARGQTSAWRVASPDTAGLMRAAALWLPRLAATGLPVPAVRLNLSTAEPAQLVLEWLPGDDLGQVYVDLPEGRLRTLARQVAGFDARVKTLGPGRGYGFLASSDDPAALSSWRAVIDQSLDRSRRRLAAAGLFDPSWADRVADLVPGLAGYFSAVEPLPFLDDATTKNVLIHHGRLSGIVDFDWLGHGDRWLAPALTAASLLAAGRNPVYAEAWVDAWKPGVSERRAFAFYRLLFCVDFLSEMGTRFNKDEPLPADRAAAARLTGGAAELLREFEGDDHG